MIKLEIDLRPISVNHMYATKKNGGRILTQKGRIYKKAVAWRVKILHPNHVMWTKNLCAEIKYYFPDKRRRDVTNYDKTILDCLSGILYKDDSQIVKITLEKYLDKINPRTEIKIWEE